MEYLMPKPEIEQSTGDENSKPSSGESMAFFVGID
jgi:hypothetical protein